MIDAIIDAQVRALAAWLVAVHGRPESIAASTAQLFESDLITGTKPLEEIRRETLSLSETPKLTADDPVNVYLKARAERQKARSNPLTAPSGGHYDGNRHERHEAPLGSPTAAREEAGRTRDRHARRGAAARRDLARGGGQRDGSQRLRTRLHELER